MNNRILIAALAGAVAWSLSQWVIWDMLFVDAMREINPDLASLSKTPLVKWAMGLSNIIWGLLFALIFDRWAGIKSLKAGAIAGAWMNALFALSIDFGLYSMTTFMPLNWLLVDVTAATVLGAIFGAVIGWVLGYKRTA